MPVLDLAVPHGPRLRLEHLVLDLNGTLAVDGRPEPGIAEALAALGGVLACHIVTADTHGTARTLASELAAEVIVLEGVEATGPAKVRVLERLGASRCAMVGNGRNDLAALRLAGLAIAVLGPEGAASDCVAAAHLVCRSGLEALRLLASRDRLVATLRG